MRINLSIINPVILATCLLFSAALDAQAASLQAAPDGIGPSDGFGPADGIGPSNGFGPGVGNTPVDGIGPSDGFTPCPRDDLRQALAQSISGDELIDLLALESEVLKLCGERAKLYNTIIEEDQKLKDLQHKDQEITSANNSPPAKKEGKWFIGGTDPIGGTDEIPPPPTNSVSTSVFSERGATAPLAGVANPSRGTSPAGYNWYTMYGTGTDLTAGISDGRGNWLLKRGDILPGDWKIMTIEAKPEKVILSHGKHLFPLPYINRKSTSVGAALTESASREASPIGSSFAEDILLGDVTGGAIPNDGAIPNGGGRPSAGDIN